VSVQAVAEVLAYSRSEGRARCVLLAIAYHAHHEDPDRLVAVPQAQLALEANVTASKFPGYVRDLVAAGELEVERKGGGRGKPTVYRLPDLTAGGPRVRRRRVTPPEGARPLMAETVPAWVEKRRAETVPETVPFTLPAGGQNPSRVNGVKEVGREGKNPPSPPQAGGAGPASLSERAGRARAGSRRQRDQAALTAATLRPPTAAEAAAWEQSRPAVAAAMGESAWHDWGIRLQLAGFDVQSGEAAFTGGSEHHHRLARRVLGLALREAA
jgi:hypothetical protein